MFILIVIQMQANLFMALHIITRFADGFGTTWFKDSFQKVIAFGEETERGFHGVTST